MESRMTLTKFRHGLSIVLMAALLTVTTLAHAVQKIRLGTVAWIGYAPFYVAVEKGFFRKHGVDVQLQDFPDPALIPSAVVSGGIQGAMYTYDLVITAVAKGQSLRVVMPIDYSNGADAIVADQSVRSVADLKGKKVAYPFSTCDNLLVVYALEQAGLRESDVEGIDTTPENVAAALTAGAAAGATYEPNITQILKLGGGKKYKVLLDSSAAPGLITDVLFFDRTFIAKHPDAVRGVMQGYLDGLAYLKAQPDESRRIVARAMSVTPDEVRMQQAGVANIPVSDMAGYFVKRDDSKSLYKVGAGIGNILVRRAQIDALPKIEDTFDVRFVHEISKSH
ncbi:MAG: nitrate ABC transporter substrate-binding protein [Betaproteobacteria bacterium]|nr:nitrate ABC transporter substrate-binding protein [Betaproteobacteria bacterium]